MAMIPVKGFASRCKIHKISQELRLASEKNGHLEWLVGTFYTHEDNPFGELIFPVNSTTGATLPGVFDRVGDEFHGLGGATGPVDRHHGGYA
jgi:hypothetical protein